MRDRTGYKRRPSPAMLRMMQSIQDHGDHAYHLKGRAEFGGAGGTVTALRKGGYVIFAKTAQDKDRLTEAGKEALTYAEHTRN